MSARQETLCFSCGQAISDPPRFNLLPSGSPCPTCRDRLLEALPAPLPGMRPTLEPVKSVDSSAESVEDSPPSEALAPRPEA